MDINKGVRYANQTPPPPPSALTHVMDTKTHTHARTRAHPMGTSRQSQLRVFFFFWNYGSENNKNYPLLSSSPDHFFVFNLLFVFFFTLLSFVDFLLWFFIFYLFFFPPFYYPPVGPTRSPANRCRLFLLSFWSVYSLFPRSFFLFILFFSSPSRSLLYPSPSPPPGLSETGRISV